MKNLRALLAAACLVGLMTVAGETGTYAQNQPSAGQQKLDSATETKIYNILNECIVEKDLNKKLAMAKEALGLYPNSTYAQYFKDQLNQARGGLLQEAIQQDKAADVFRIGGEVLDEDTENLNYLLTLAEYSSRLARKRDYSYADKGTLYARKSIELINTGKKPVGIDDKAWDQRRELVLGSMYQTVGLFLIKANKDNEALNSLTEAIKHDCSDPDNYLLVSQIYKNRYDALTGEYQQLPEDKKAADEGKAKLEKIKAVADQMIDAYGRMLVVSENRPNYENHRSRIRPIMEDLYKFRHDGKADGLQSYIDGLKSACAK